LARCRFTPIHRACWGREQRHTDTLKVFLDAGVAYDEAATNGQTPLTMTEDGNPASHALLLEYKAKASAHDEM